MRTSRRAKPKKNNYRVKVKKKKYSNRAKKPWGLASNISQLDLENINEVLRVYKMQRADGKGYWKVVPKDSCEVYKDRRKRQVENERQRQEKIDSENYSQEEKDTCRQKKKKKQRRKAVKRKETLRKTAQRPKKNRQE